MFSFQFEGTLLIGSAAPVMRWMPSSGLRRTPVNVGTLAEPSRTMR
jgi:hypothetical protein